MVVNKIFPWLVENVVGCSRSYGSCHYAKSDPFLVCYEVFTMVVLQYYDCTLVHWYGMVFQP